MFDISKIDRSKDIKLEQPWNMRIIISGFLTLKFPNFTETKFLQPPKIFLKLVTYDTSKLVISIIFKYLQFENAPNKSVIFIFSPEFFIIIESKKQLINNPFSGNAFSFVVIFISYIPGSIPKE